MQEPTCKMPKFTSTTKRIQVGNGQYVGVLFVIPVIITIQRHRFEIFTLVSEIHENVDLVLGIKNLFELEGVIDSQDSCLSFLNRPIPFFPRKKVEVKPKEQKLNYFGSTFCGRNIRNGYYKVARHKRTNDPYYEAKIHQKQGNVQGDKWHP